MMQKLWQKKLELNYSKEVFDIVQFGSSVVEGKEPNDIDIAVIFQKMPLKEQLKQAQEIKKELQEVCQLPVHINSFDLYSFFDPSNFTKENILFYGISIISKDFFAKKFGLNPKIQIYYSLKDLKKKDKIRFNYTLNGKKGRYGLLREYKGELLKPGLIEISPEYQEHFIEAIKRITPNFKRILTMKSL
jgi:predicted nucleotidyltransferase